MALIVVAAGLGIGLTMLVAAFVPARPRLSDLLDRREIAPASTDAPFGSLAARALRLLDRLNVTVPQADLDIVDEPREVLLLRQLSFAAAGALLVPLWSLLLAAGGISSPAVFTGGAALGAAVVGWFLPVRMLATRARAARISFKGALASYFELVALGRLGDLGPVAALTFPASIGSGPAFARIRQVLSEAQLRGQMAWQGLATLATTMGVAELDDLGTIVTAAGEDGASIVATLRAKATSIRAQQLAEQKAAGSIRSDRMDAPVGLMGITFILFVAFPGLYGLMAA